MEWSFRPMQVADLPDLLVVQERGAVAGLGHIFPQATYPFPRQVVSNRWDEELRDPAIAAYVAIGEEAGLVGFAARREDEVLHFGTALETWGSGLATGLHDALIATYPPDVSRVRLRVLAENRRARRFYENLGWRPTGVETLTSFPPHPTMLEHVLDRADRAPAG